MAGVSTIIATVAVATAFRVLCWWRQRCKQISNGCLEIFKKINNLLTINHTLLIYFFQFDFGFTLYITLTLYLLRTPFGQAWLCLILVKHAQNNLYPFALYHVPNRVRRSSELGCGADQIGCGAAQIRVRRSSGGCGAAQMGCGGGRRRRWYCVGKSGTFQCPGINYKRANLLCIHNGTIESPH